MEKEMLENYFVNTQMWPKKKILRVTHEPEKLSEI
jgi:hypothetical protein